jgi:hypothetical protein
MENKFDYFKNWLTASDWRMWLIGGGVIIITMWFLRERFIEHEFLKKQKEFMAFIHNEEQAIENSREKAEARDQDIHDSINRIHEAGDALLKHTDQKIDHLRGEFNAK